VTSLTLKNIPDTILRALRKAAEAERRSLNQEVLHILASSLGVDKKFPHAPAVDEQLQAWRRLAAQWTADVDADELVSARTPGREIDF
jgi:plasmid stability protein